MYLTCSLLLWIFCQRNVSRLQSRKRLGTGLKQWFCGDFFVQIMFYACFLEPSVALSPTSKQWDHPVYHQPNRLEETLANGDKRIHLGKTVFCNSSLMLSIDESTSKLLDTPGTCFSWNTLFSVTLVLLPQYTPLSGVLSQATLGHVHFKYPYMEHIHWCVSAVKQHPITNLFFPAHGFWHVPELQSFSLHGVFNCLGIFI